jgi:hypothetical protein
MANATLFRGSIERFMLKKLSNILDFPELKRENYSFKNKKESDLYDGLDFLALIKSWKDIAGAKLSEHSIPLKNQNGILVILSNHSLFASEMKFLEPIIKKKIFAIYPKFEKHIKTINFIVDSTHFASQVKKFSNLEVENKKKSSLPHPFSPEFKKLEKEANAFFENVQDLENKKMLISIYMQSKFKDDK